MTRKVAMDIRGEIVEAYISMDHPTDPGGGDVTIITWEPQSTGYLRKKWVISTITGVCGDPYLTVIGTPEATDDS